MNIIVILWRAALAFLYFSFVIVTFPLGLLFSACTALLVMAIRGKQRRTQARYSWTYHPIGKRRASGYQRARYGRFS